MKEQLELQRAQVAANAANVDRQIQAAATQQLKQLEANTSQQLEQQKAHAEDQNAQQTAQNAQLKLQREQSQARAEETKQQIEASDEANKIARETHALEVYMRAVDALGSESPDRQHAGIALLGQIARESEKYVTPAAEVLAAFVKKHAQRPRPLTLPGARSSALPEKPERSGSMIAAALRTVAALLRPAGHARDLRGITLNDFVLSAEACAQDELSRPDLQRPGGRGAARHCAGGGGTCFHWSKLWYAGSRPPALMMAAGTPAGPETVVLPEIWQCASGAVPAPGPERVGDPCQ